MVLLQLSAFICVHLRFLRLKKPDCSAPGTGSYNPSMLARVFSAAVNGIEAYSVEVEVNSGWGDTVIVIE